MAYLMFLAATYTYVVEPWPSLDERILVPMLVGSVVGASCLTWWSLNVLSARSVGAVLVMAMCAWLSIGNVPAALAVTRSQHQGEGLWYTRPRWERSCVIGAIRTLPSATPLISDDIDAINFYLHRPEYRIPELERRAAMPLGQPFGRGNNRLERLYRDGGAYLVLFAEAPSYLKDLYGGVTSARMSALTSESVKIFDGCDGAIYIYSPQPLR